MDPDPRRQFGTSRLLVELRYVVEDCQARTRATLRVVVVGLGIAEERHHAVTKILGDFAAESRYRFSGRAVVAGHHFSPFLRIETTRDFGRAYQIAEQQR